MHKAELPKIQECDFEIEFWRLQFRDCDFGITISELRFRDYDFGIAISGLGSVDYDVWIAIRVSDFGCVGCSFVVVRVVVAAVLVCVACH